MAEYIEFDDLENGLGSSLGDELNGRLNAVKTGANAATRPAGTWTNSQTYYPNDLVTNAGRTWRAKTSTLNVTPVEGANWTAFLVSGPAVSVAGNMAVYGDTAGNILADGGRALVIQGYSNANGQDLKKYQVSELLTIAAAASSNTAGIIPAGALVTAVTVRVTVAIPTATTFDIGVAGATTRYGSGKSVALNTTNVSSGTNNPSCYDTNTAIVITPSATPATNVGRVLITWYYELATPPTS